MCEVKKDERDFYEILVEKQKLLDEECKLAYINKQEATDEYEKAKNDSLFVDEVVAYIDTYRKRKMYNVTCHSKRGDGFEVYHHYQVYADDKQSALVIVKGRLSMGFVWRDDPVTMTLHCGTVVYDSFIVTEVK